MKQRQDSLGYLVSDVSRLMRRAFQKQIEGSALTPMMTLAQARALVYVSRNEGIRQVDLADLLEVQPITLARLIDQLAEAGLVERRADPADRRAHRVYLTAEAQPQLAAIERAVVVVRRQAVQDVGKAELATVLAVLQAMRDNLTGR